MTEQITKTKNAVTIKGSAKLVTDYLNFGINSILFQRGIYPPETFNREDHFGLSIYMSTDEKVNLFITSVLTQIKEWLLMEKVKRMSVVVMNKVTSEVLERWDFKLEYEKKASNETADGIEVTGSKELKAIQNEIRDVLRQICSSVSFLPLLDAPCTFDLLTYTHPDTQVPDQWNETKPVFIANSQALQFRSFSTSFHKMDTVVSYKAD